MALLTILPAPTNENHPGLIDLENQYGAHKPYLAKLCTRLDIKSLTYEHGVEAVETALKLARKWAYVKMKALCALHNVLLILDEVQTGLGRTGKLRGTWFTFGGNPLGCAVAVAALDVLIEENLSERAEEMGKLMRVAYRSELKSIGPSADSTTGYIQTVRGKGLLNAIVIDPNLSTKKRGAWELCLLMKSRGVLAKPTHSNIIRLAPPLIIGPEEVKQVVKVIGECLKDLDQIKSIRILQVTK
ncbi:hypothetical protein H4Q26_001600 [Puccinia striiformis f. sp. tritici PST-130]|nr:hypothetical protein H4Q26_001600 [Puccinia striiformis f. sp. tritici PST-130]